MIKLLQVIENNNKNAQYTAIFDINGKIKNVSFGDKTKKMNYTIHKNNNRKDLYIKRHLNDLKTNDPTRPGYLSMFLLWNKPTLKESIKDYNNRLKSNNWKI